MAPLSLWCSRCSGALADRCINTRRLLPPVVWGGGLCSGANRVLQPARKSKDNHAKDGIVPGTCAMFEMGPIGGLTSQCRFHPPRTRTVTRIEAPTSSIPVTVVADSLGKGGPGGDTMVGGGGWGGGGCSSPGPETMYVCIGACMSECTDGRFMCVSAYVCMHIFMYRYIFMYRCMYIYMCVCVSARVFVCLCVCLHMMKAYMHACTLKIL